MCHLKLSLKIHSSLHPTLSPIASAPYWDVEYDSGRKKRMLTTNKLIGDKDIEILAAKTGNTVEKVLADSMRTKYFDAEQALAYGLVAKILKSEQHLPTKPTFLQAL